MSEPDERSAGPSNPNLLRDRLANERTFLARIRTGIAITALGFVVARFEIVLYEVAQIEGREFDQSELTLALGLLLVIAGPSLVLAAAYRYFFTDRSLTAGGAGESRVPVVLTLVMAAGFAAAGVAIVVHLLSTWPG